MIRRLIRLILQLVMAALVLFALTTTWILFDGLTDMGNEADVAIVPGHENGETGASWAEVQSRLDLAAKLYEDRQFQMILVSGEVDLKTGHDEAASMAEYLKQKGIPAAAILVDHEINDTHEMASRWVAKMMVHKFNSAMLITHYYQITRLKLALKLAGGHQVEHAHVGTLHKADLGKVTNEVVAFYDFVAKYYLVPLTDKVKEEIQKDAKLGSDKVKAEAEKAKEKVDKGLDSMSQ